MPILPIILTIVIVGVLMWAVNAYIPMAPKIKQLLNIVVVILLIIWLFRLFGVWDYLAGVTV
ncbi:MAG: Thivi_2564 family membrane protein [Gemmatimonadota bacterium]